MNKLPLLSATFALGLIASIPVAAAPLIVTVSVESLVPADSVAFAPLRLGFHSGSFDAFDLGEAATAPIISVAEGGSGADWFPAFAAADPGATLGSVVPDPAGPLLPGGSAQSSFTVDPLVNPYFTFAAMVVPSNDFFIGNDSPTQYRLFDDSGALLISEITQSARQVWDAGSEVFDPAAAAFVGENGLRAEQNSVVAFNFAELAAFDGLTTGAGYTFASQLAADDQIYRISFDVRPVPVPAALPLFVGGLASVVAVARRRRQQGPTARG